MSDCNNFPNCGLMVFMSADWVGILAGQTCVL